MTEVWFEPRLGFLTLCGHAGAAPRGRDPVCAALSILAETAADLPGARSRRGDGWIVVCAEPEGLAVLCRGFRLLAREFPSHVKYEEEEA